MHLILHIAVSALISTFVGHAAGADAIPQGVYVAEGGRGSLTIQSSGRFQLETLGTNGHTCEVEAVIQDRAEAVTAEECRIRFERSLDRVSVHPDPASDEACRRHCGMRAWFQGDFFREVPACRAEPVKRERDRFTALYRARNYRQAAEVLSALLNRCGRFMYWLPDEAQARNDLAITYHRMSDDAACIGVLSPLRRAFIEDENITGRAFAPSDEGVGQEMVRITRFNWKACGGEVPASATGDRQRRRSSGCMPPYPVPQPQ